MNYVLWIAFGIYSIYTLRFALAFNRTADIYFTRKQKIIHNILIWLIPFFWIMIVKTVASPSPTTKNSTKNRGKGNFFESGIAIWGDRDDSHSSHDGGHSSDGD